MSEQDEKKSPDGSNGKEKEEEQKDDLDLDEEEEDLDDLDDDDDKKKDDEDDDKPLTRKDLKEFQQGVKREIDNRFISRRHSNKHTKNNYQPNRKEGEKDEVSSRLDRIEVIEQKRQFGYENNLSPEEVDAVFKINPRPTKKTLEDPFIQGGLEKLRARKNTSENIPSGAAARNFGVEGKKWAELTPEERQANLGDRRKAILANKRR